MSLRDELQTIYDQCGRLTPPLVVERARDETHPLHKHFEWEDSIAGEAWRRHQAHELIQSVKIVYRESTGGEEYAVRAFHAVRTTQGYVYEPVEKVVQDPLLTQIVRADMEREWRTLKKRYDQFDEFWHMVRVDLAS